LGEQVSAVQALVGLLDAGELLLLAVGQLLNVLPEREPGAFEILGELLVTGAAGFVPDLAADLIQGIGGGLDDMKRIQGDDRVRAALGDRPGDPVGVIAGHVLDLRAALLTQHIQELLDRFAVPAIRCPHQPAGVMIDDDGQVLVAFADRDLIKSEALQAREQVAALLGLGADARADPPDGPPRDPHQHTDRGL